MGNQNAAYYRPRDSQFAQSGTGIPTTNPTNAGQENKRGRPEGKVIMSETKPTTLEEQRLALLQRRDRITFNLSRTANYDEREVLLQTLNQVVNQVREIEREILLRDKAA
jgi:hypothetical protein